MTDESVEIILYPRNLESQEIIYAQEIIEMDKKIFQKLDQFIEYKTIGETIEVSLPKHSTLSIGSGINIENLDYHKVIIEGDDLIELSEQTINLFNTKRTGLSKVVAWYDIK